MFFLRIQIHKEGLEKIKCQLSGIFEAVKVDQFNTFAICKGRPMPKNVWRERTQAGGPSFRSVWWPWVGQSSPIMSQEVASYRST